MVVFKKSISLAAGILLFATPSIMAQPTETDKTPQEQLSQFEKDCANNIMAACNNAGASYGSGFGAKPDIQKAQKFYTIACLNGIGQSCNNLGLMYANKQELGVNYEKARSFMEKGCELENANACANYASYLRAGLGGDKDFSKARSISTAACSNGSGIACDTFGILALNGEGGDKDVPAAIKAFDEGCRLEIGQACNNIAVMVVQGIGITPDPEKAFALFRRSCVYSYVQGCKGYASLSIAVKKEDELLEASGDRLIIFGETFAENSQQDRSLKMFKQACDKRAGKGCYYVGLSYLNGLHGTKDRAKAKAMFDRGCGFENLLSCTNKVKMEDGSL